jgi:hypothetical protein
MKKLEYGIVKEFDNYDLWFEPITDKIDGLVIRNKEGCILDVFIKDRQQEYNWDGSGD